MKIRKVDENHIIENTAKILVCGGRHFDNYDFLEFALDSVIEDNDLDFEQCEIVSGHCSGADTLGEEYAIENGIRCRVFQANWKTYGIKAGPIRNSEMVSYLSDSTKPIVVAFISENSRGTRDTVKKAEKAGYSVYVISSR